MPSPSESDMSAEEATAGGKPTKENEINPGPNSSEKRKPQKMYVLVPKAPYKICKVKSTSTHPIAVAHPTPSEPLEPNQQFPDIRSTARTTSIASDQVLSGLGPRLPEQQNIQTIITNQFPGTNTASPISSLRFNKKALNTETEMTAGTSAVNPAPEQAIANTSGPSKPQMISPSVGPEILNKSSLDSSADYIAKLVCQRVGEMFTNASVCVIAVNAHKLVLNKACVAAADSTQYLFSIACESFSSIKSSRCATSGTTWCSRTLHAI